MTRQLNDHDTAVRLLRGAFLLDHSVSVTQLGSLFDRHGDTPVQQLKRNIAEAYGVAWSFPATCGTSPLNVLALLAVAPPGSAVAVNRDCHVSVHAALVHGGYRPVYFRPPIHPETGLPLGPAARDVEALLEEHRDVRCVVLTYPNYFGIAGECGSIVDAAHRRGLPVIVDAAHGAPLHFCSGLPAAAEDLGADIVLQSTHKSMGALSQGSVVLFKTDRFLDRFYDAVAHLGLISTSFSYPTLSSIELAVARHQLAGQETWQDAIEQAERFRVRVAQIDGITTFSTDAATLPGFCDLDRTRVTLDVSRTGLTGYEFEKQLAASQVYAEMSTNQHVLLLFTPGTRPEDSNYLLSAIERAAEAGDGTRRTIRLEPPALPALRITPREAYYARKRTVETDDAVGEISAETIAPYPPGSAVVVAGEALDAATIEYLRLVRSSGAVLYGASDPELRRIRVVEV